MAPTAPETLRLEEARRSLQQNISATERHLLDLRRQLSELDKQAAGTGTGTGTVAAKAEQSGVVNGTPRNGTSEKHEPTTQTPEPPKATNDEETGKAPWENNSLAETATQKQNRIAKWPLLQDEYRRYGRQMIVDEIGLKGTDE